MKKLVSLLLAALMLLSVVPAASAVTAEDNLYFEDGSCILTGYGSPDPWESLGGEEESDSADIFSFLRRIVKFLTEFFEKLFGKESKVQTASKTKYAAYYDSKGNLLWTVYLSADFSFDGEKAECTEVNTFYEIKDSDWSVLSSDCEKTDNTATGTFVVKQHKLGVSLKEIERVLRLTCDEKGNIQ